MNATAVLVLMAVSLVGTSSAMVFSEDYQDGYRAGAGLIGGMKYMDGLLEGTRIVLVSMDRTTGEPGLDTFLSTFVSGVSARYNEEVAEYNALVDDINGATRLVLGDDAGDDYILEYQRFYT